MRFDMTYAVLTEDSVAEGDAAEQGWVDPDTEAGTEDRPARGWRPAAAIAFLLEHSATVETCWTPDNSRRGMSLYGNGPYHEGEDPLETDYCLHVKASRRELERLARRLATQHGVYFANIPRLRRARRYR